MAGMFNDAVLTQKGIALLAKAQAGKCTIKLTRAASGNGSYTGTEDLSQRTALKSEKQTFALDSVKTQNLTNVFIKFTITNKQESGNLTNGYLVTEIGLFATDPDEGEILYAIATGVSGQCDYMPAYNDLIPSTITIDFLTEVSNADNVTIVMPNERYFYDDTTGDKYHIGINNGLLYYEEAE